MINQMLMIVIGRGKLIHFQISSSYDHTQLHKVKKSGK